MEKNIHVVRQGNDLTYGKESNYFGHQGGCLNKFMTKTYGVNKRIKLNISTEPKPGTLEVSMFHNPKNPDTFKVTQPRALRGAEFCKKGVARYFGKAVAQQKRLKLYVKL